MTIQNINQELKKEYNKIATHPLQTYEWGEFREKTGVKVIRRGIFDGIKLKLVEGFQLTLHNIPHTPWNIGYLPKGGLPTKEVVEELKRIGKEEKCIFIQLEPNIQKMDNGKWTMENLGLRPSAHPLFTKYTFILDLTKSEEELLKNMHPKTRYNIKVAQKHNVVVKEDNSQQAFETFLRLNHETTTRQKFYSHPNSYFQKMRKVLQNQELGIMNQENRETEHQTDRHLITENRKLITDQLSMHLFTATYQNKTLVSWILFIFKDTLYYPYGASSHEHKDVMASNLVMWETIKFGKKLGLKKFDMWGSLEHDADPKDPWFGFHQFKQRYGGTLVEFVGSYDLVINPLLYQWYKIADKLRWLYLRTRK